LSSFDRAYGFVFFLRRTAGLYRFKRATEMYARSRAPARKKAPLYGRNAHRTRAGLHADGLNHFWSMYSPFDDLADWPAAQARYR